MADHSKWMQKQIAALVDLGINPLDASNAVRSFLALLPDGADPDTYIVPHRELAQNISSEAVIADARADWYSQVAPRYARLLDASEAT